VLAQNIVFAVLAVAMAASAIRMVTTRNVVHAALYLVIVFAGFAAQYILLAAEFVAVVQVLVYIGAIVVLLLFGVMLTRARIGQELDLDNDQRWVSAIVSLASFGLLAALLIDAFDDTKLDLANGVATSAAGGNTARVSDAIFSDYLIAFELSSILLLAALVGAIVVARRD
jgi:NADH-quinone oxidoreductase subunit J